MTKEFIPYAEALELKELGFDEPCLAFYWNTGKFYTTAEYPHSIETHKQNQLGDYNYDSTSAPTYSQAFKFFREKYQLWGMIYPRDGWNYMIQEVDKTTSCFGESWHKQSIANYEEAELECLKKLIEIVKQK
jgi:hypothetical protein